MLVTALLREALYAIADAAMLRERSAKRLRLRKQDPVRKKANK